MKITEVCIKNPVFAWMIMAATVLFGGVAASRIGISQFPDVDFPTINVSVSWEGAAPEVVEHDIVEPIEEAVMQVQGVRNVTSTSRQGGGNVTVELDLSRNVDLALQDVQTRVAQVQRNLPRDIEPPVVSKTNPEDQPIMWVGLSGPFAPQVLSDYARYRVKERLQTVPGVGEIQVGSVSRNIRIWIDSDKLDERQVTVSEVLAAIGNQHVELPAGRLETSGREVNVRVMGEAFDLDEFRTLVVRDVPGAPVYLSDVAMVEDGFEDIRRISRVNGEPAQGMGIRKQRGSNAVAVARGVKEAIAEIQKTLPAGMELGINFDSTQFIEESVHEIQFELMLSVILTAIICWLFLGTFGATLNVILAIPMSLLGTVACIYFFGFTLNTFTLLGLALAVGIVVDDAIMVLENIFRHGEMGKDRVRAAREGTAEISFAALAATLAVCAIFLPVVFMKGIIGKFFLQFGVTLCIAVLLSYVEAITLAPARSAQMLKTGAERQSKLGHFVDVAFDKLSHAYSRVLAIGLRHPLSVLAMAVIVFIASMFVFKKLPSEFVPSQDQSRLMIRLQTAVGADLAETDRVFRRAETYLQEQKEVVRVFGNVGGFGGGGVNTGILFVTMVPPDQREKSQQDFAAMVRKELNGYPGVRAVVQDLSQQGFSAQRGFPIEFSVRGSEWDKLIDVANDMRDKLQQSGLATDIDTDYQVGMPELRIVPDRARAADLGVSVEEVATTINALVGGVRSGKYSTGGRRIDIRTRLLANQRTRPEDLSRLRVRTAAGALVPLSSLVKEDERPALQSVTRRDRERAISIYGNVAPGKSQGEALEYIESISKELPTGYRAVLGGSSVAFRESMGQLVFALILGIMVAYMVLASQFNSFLHPVTVLSILPLSIAGAAFALLITGKTLNIFSMIGLLLLLGIAKKNSIILVDYAVQKQNEGMSAHDAMLKAGPVRLRPIMMTSAATLMAAVPPALALGPGAETRGPMAVAIIGGLVISTALSLLVVPAFFVVADRAKMKLSTMFSRGSKDEGEAEEATAH
ncbi:MAG TPA: efflux RND transporter permease subunit [Thermoanaerobaculia bacterium]|jgi:hydrophobe/amphiphile efflux-1 (HAE1) family protein|nr:efflux RND transporter permease subunit [Thermoanaerobaculia bacterium]